jgi:hypothetical protein
MILDSTLHPSSAAALLIGMYTNNLQTSTPSRIAMETMQVEDIPSSSLSIELPKVWTKGDPR